MHFSSAYSRSFFSLTLEDKCRTWAETFYYIFNDLFSTATWVCSFLFFVCFFLFVCLKKEPSQLLCKTRMQRKFTIYQLRVFKPVQSLRYPSNLGSETRREWRRGGGWFGYGSVRHSVPCYLSEVIVVRFVWNLQAGKSKT